jgi:vesicle coat complex subunit
VAKLYDIEPTLVEDQGFVESLQELLSDANPMVVANAVASLSEVCTTSLLERHHYLHLPPNHDFHPAQPLRSTTTTRVLVSLT